MTQKLTIQYGDPALLTPNPWNPNHMSAENEQKLFASLDQGEFKPILVRELKDGTLQVLGGEHRRNYYIDRERQAPFINLGKMTDERAKQITLADNARYGYDDQYALNEILREINDVAIETLPMDEEELRSLMGSTQVDLDDLVGLDDDMPELDRESERTTDMMATLFKSVRVKVSIEDAEEFERNLARVIEKLGLDDSNQAINRGEALVVVLNHYLENNDD